MPLAACPNAPLRARAGSLTGGSAFQGDAIVAVLKAAGVKGNHSATAEMVAKILAGKSIDEFAKCARHCPPYPRAAGTTGDLGIAPASCAAA